MSVRFVIADRLSMEPDQLYHNSAPETSLMRRRIRRRRFRLHCPRRVRSLSDPIMSGPKPGFGVAANITQHRSVRKEKATARGKIRAFMLDVISGLKLNDSAPASPPGRFT